MEMESGNLSHLGTDLIVQILMLYSTSPDARLLAKSMMTDDPFNIDVKLDDNAVNRNVEILNVYLKQIGLRLVFVKRRKELISPILISPIEYDKPKEERLEDPFVRYNKEIPYEEVEKDMLKEIESEKFEHPIEIYPISYE